MKILIVSPFFPPFSLVGAKRMESFSTYLSRNRHDVTVLTYSTKTMEDLVGKSNLNSPIPRDLSVCNLPNLKIFKFPFAFCINHFLEVRAWDKYLRAFGEMQFDAILVSSGPVSTEGPVARFAQKNDIPLVLDLRDLNVILDKQKNDGGIKQFIKSAIWKYQQHYPELECIKAASKIVVVTPGMGEELIEEYGISADKIEVIYNGFDETILSTVKSVKPEDRKVQFGYFGKMMYYSPERGKRILIALDMLKKQGIDIELVHIGPGSNEIIKTIDELGLDNTIYRSLGTMDYSSGMAIMMSMRGYFIEYKDPIGLGTKVFDYIFCNKPIICVAPVSCVLSKMVAEFDNGYAVDSVDDIVKTVLEVIRCNKDTLEEGFNIHNYSREFQNANYEKLLATIVANKRK